MKVQEVMMRAMSGQISWLDAADILRWSPRSVRRWRARWEKLGCDGLFDRRRRRPSPKRIPMDKAQKVLRLYREKYSDFNVRHFHEKLQEEHGIQLSYQWVKNALQAAGLVRRRAKRSVHRQARERRPMVGMLMHCDGSTHQWLPEANWQPDLVVFLDDATNEVYWAQLVEEEDTRSMMLGLREMIKSKGLFCSLYTDRGSHFFLTPKAGQEVSKVELTQIGRALAQLGIEHIPSYSPEGRGRMERLFGTWQGRLPQELRVKKITTMEGANEYLQKVFVPWHNRKLAVKAQEEGTAFVPVVGTDLDAILCIQSERVVACDNTVSYGKMKLQIAPNEARYSFSKCRVKVCEHLDGSLSVRYGPKILGWYDAEGKPKANELKKAA